MADVIELTDFEFNTIIGILDREQRGTQPICVDLSMELPLEETGRTGRLDRSVNYADVQAWILTLAQQGRWRLLESLSHAIANLLLLPPAPCEARGRIQAIELRIRKPTILDGAVPGIRIRREASWVDVEESAVSPGVIVQTLASTPVQGAWRIVLDAGASWTVPGTWSLHVLGGSGTHAQEGLPDAAVHHGDVVARAPGRRIVASESGLALLGVGSPS